MAEELKAKLDVVEGCLPRYLYRTYSDDSHGKNSLWAFKPGSTTYEDNLSDISYQRAKDMLQKHLLWERFSADQFISWTDSLLWALQLAIRPKFGRKKLGDKTGVNICVLDTSKIDKSSFFAASDLLRIYEVADNGKLAHRYYTTEYLYHGGLFVHGSSSTVPLNRLLECGLFSLLPEMDDDKWKELLWNAVEHFRVVIFPVLQPVVPAECRTALQLASLFDKEFMMPLMVALLALKRRDPDDPSFLTLVADYAEPPRDFTNPVPSCKGTHAEAPELENFAKLMSAAHANFERTRSRDPGQMNELRNTFDALSVRCDNIETTMKALPDTDVPLIILSELSTVTEAVEASKRALTENTNVSRARATRTPPSRAEQSTPKPFPARLPSGLRTEKREAAPRPKSISVVFADEGE